MPGICLPSRSLAPRDAVRLAVLAEELGFSGVWVSEVANLDAVATMGAMAQATESIGIGSAAIPIASRSAAVLAMAGATLEGLAPGRVTLGLGVSSAAIVEGWHGREFGSALQSVADCFEIIREAWSGASTRHHGPAAHSVGFRLDPFTGGVPRLYLAALGRRLRTLGAEMADGIILNFLPRTSAPRIVAGLTPARDRFGVAALVRVADDELAPGSVARVRKEIASYTRIPEYAAWMAQYGLKEASDAAPGAPRGLEQAAASLPDDFVSDCSVTAGVGYCPSAFGEMLAVGVVPLAVPAVEPGDIAAVERLMRGIASSTVSHRYGEGS